MKKLKALVIGIILAGVVVAHYFPVGVDEIDKYKVVGDAINEAAKNTGEAKENTKGLLDKLLAWIKTSTGYDNGSAESIAEDSLVQTEHGNIEKFDLLYVVDGDTIIIDNYGVEAKVRLIGIDTPESVHEDESKNNEYGQMASKHTKELLESVSEVYLTYDKELTDDYGRILAYVWITDPTNTDNLDEIKDKMLNYIIVADGYAVDKVFEPNTYYAMYFEEAKNEAKNQNAGLWQYDGYRNLVGQY